ncbi:MAG TPA: tetratricopeptide repeat protein, partial [Terriglobia bacterium]|nr:tetratricopeptide repeat protein [Terriglobia bacterium]
RSKTAGVQISGWSWSCQDWDFDHDGYPDLYIANGFISGPDPRNLESFFWRQVIARSPATGARSSDYERGWDAINELVRSDGTWAGYQRNTFYANNRDGTFAEAAGAVGLDFIDDSRAFALADFDHDGRLEVFLKNRSGPQLRILRNVAEGIGNSIAFRLRGTNSNRDAIGTWITVEAGGAHQMKLLQAGSGFCSQHSKEIFFGLGHSAGFVRATIRWPSGVVSSYENLPSNQRVEIVEGSQDFHAEPFAKTASRPHVRGGQPREVRLPTVFGTWLIAPLDAPDFSLPDLSGKTHALSGLAGTPVLLNFWATWAGASIRFLDQLEQESGRARQAGVQILTIAVDAADNHEKARAIAREHQLSLPVLLGSDKVASVYNLLFRYLFDRHRDLPVPTSFLIDKESSIAKVYQGPVEASQIVRDVARIPRTAKERQQRALPFAGQVRGTYPRNYFTYGLVFAQHGYSEVAEAAFKRAISQDPNAAEAYYDLGTLYMQKKQWERAEEVLQKAVQLKPGDSMGLNNLGIVTAQRGKPTIAEQYFKQVLKSDPSNNLAISNLADLYRSQQRFQDAQQLLEEALKRSPDDPQLNYKIGMAYAGQGRNSQAQTYLERAVRLQPDNAEALDNLGVVYALTGQLDRAAEMFSLCIQKAPRFDQPYLNLARVDVKIGRRDEAVQVLKALLAQIPGHDLAQKYLEQLQR